MPGRESLQRRSWWDWSGKASTNDLINASLHKNNSSSCCGNSGSDYSFRKLSTTHRPGVITTVLFSSDFISLQKAHCTAVRHWFASPRLWALQWQGCVPAYLCPQHPTECLAIPLPPYTFAGWLNEIMNEASKRTQENLCLPLTRVPPPMATVQFSLCLTMCSAESAKFSTIKQ